MQDLTPYGKMQDLTPYGKMQDLTPYGLDRAGFGVFEIEIVGQA